MKLSTARGLALELQIVGYQFPEINNAPWDSDWLLIRIEVSHPMGNWSTTDPCLLTFEAVDLANWLENVASGGPDLEDESFTEPNL